MDAASTVEQALADEQANAGGDDERTALRIPGQRCDDDDQGRDAGDRYGIEMDARRAFVDGRQQSGEGEHGECQSARELRPRRDPRRGAALSSCGGWIEPRACRQVRQRAARGKDEELKHEEYYAKKHQPSDVTQNAGYFHDGSALSNDSAGNDSPGFPPRPGTGLPLSVTPTGTLASCGYCR
jgi:hypothetical protein